MHRTSSGLRQTTMSAATRGSRSQHGGGSSSSSSNTILINLDIYIMRATIGRDISPEDDDLIVLFRRNSKEVTSEPTRWHADHVAEWNQHVGIQTSLLRNKHATLASDSEFLKKEYEVVLVALPSHSAVALFTVDFADVVQSQRPGRPKAFRISPAKCRDLAATLEFELVWEYAAPPPAPLTPTSLATTSSTSMLSLAGRRTNVSVVSMSSQNSELTTTTDTASITGSSSTAAGAPCSDCRSMRRRLERKEMQIVQLETFLKESQKRIDSLVFENEELLVREQAETKNAGQYRALNMRLLQELEMAFQFCAQQMIQAQEHARATGATAPPPLFMFLPQFEFMERVKKCHVDLGQVYSGGNGLDLDPAAPTNATNKSPEDVWRSFDFRAEMDAALERNQRLQRQLEFLSRSLVYEVHDDHDRHGATATGHDDDGTAMPTMKRTVTNASERSELSQPDGDDAEGPLSGSKAAPVRTVTEQLNALERENFTLKAKLESALVQLKHHQHHGPAHSEAAETTSSTSSGGGGGEGLIVGGPSIPMTPVDEAGDRLRDERDTAVRELEATKKELAAVRQQLAEAPPEPATTLNPLAQSAVSVSSTGSGSGAVASGGGGGGGGSDFLNKIYKDVGKAKIALEEKVKKLNQELHAAQSENTRLVNELELTRLAAASFAAGSSSMDEPSSIVEIVEDEAPRSPALKTLEQRLTSLQAQIDDKASQLKVQDQELQFMRQHLSEKANKVTELEAERGRAQQALAQAQKRVTQLEIRLEALQDEHREQKAQQDHEMQHQQLAAAAMSARNDGRGDEVSDLTKQLKLARQEVMQLRYRSNNLESVHEKLEEALKEKKQLQVKLTALEGQLYEQRSRTISENNFAAYESTGGGGSSITDATMIEELQKQLDQKSAQLLIAQREAETLRRELTTTTPRSSDVRPNGHGVAHGVDLAELEAKVTRFAGEIDRLCERNDEQAARIGALGERIETVTREKYELEGIMKEMLREVDELGVPGSAVPASASASASGAPVGPPPKLRVVVVGDDDDEDKAPVVVRTVAAPAASSAGRVVDRYANALRSSGAFSMGSASSTAGGGSSRPPAPSPRDATFPVSKNKVAHLIRNFSSDPTTTITTDNDVGAPDDEPLKHRNNSLGAAAVKKPTKVDFRQRQGSFPNGSS